ncbi:MAG: tol-pal system protein YbgF [Desulfobulbaceae bacterium DB1]|nr:MAG: tol-pal system protein YbgF [Desulfobulbaceae bacterium DB1]
MKKIFSRSFYSLLAVGLVPLLSGCVTDQDFRGLQLQFRSLDNRLVELERDFDQLQNNAGSSVEVMRKQQAGMGSTIDKLNAELLQIKGQLDESRHRYRNLQSENQKLQEEISLLGQKTDEQAGSLQERITTVESSTSEIDTRLANVHTNLAEMQEEQAKAAALAAEMARKKAELARQSSSSQQRHEITPVKIKKSPGIAAAVSEQAEPEPQAVTAIQPNQAQAKASGNTMYDEGLELFKAKKYKEAHDVFAQFAKKHPNDELAINARFWIGDCLFNQDEFAMAILEYQNVIADYPNHVKAPAALFKQGMAFEKLQDSETAKIVYNKILAEYPSSDQVDAAKGRLSKLGN